MDIAFRVESSDTIGSGHLVRCINLANNFLSKGHTCYFIINNKSKEIVKLIKSNNHKILKLGIRNNKKIININKNDTKFTNWLGHKWSIDAQNTIKYIKSNRIKILIVDHYAIDSRWERKVKKYVNQLVVIDDLDNRDHHSDFIIDQNFRPDYERHYKKNICNCIRLMGPSYALINPVYSKFKKKYIKQKISNIFVFFGGSDQNLLTEKVLDILSSEKFNKYQINVVIGLNNNRYSKIKSKFNKKKNLKIFYNLNNLADLMKKSDLAIGALGINTWERMCVGLPTLVISSGSDQNIFAEYLNRRKLIKLLGYSNSLKPYTLSKKINLHVSKLNNKNVSHRLQKIVGGKGTERVVKNIINVSKFGIMGQINLRPANLNDEELLFRWANDPYVRANAFISEPIERKIHKKWFDTRLNNLKNHRLYIAYTKNNKVPVGQVRFDLIDSKWRIDFSIDSIFRNQGYGLIMLNLAMKKLAVIDSHGELIAQVKKKNVSSYNVFKGLNFKISGENNKRTTFRKKLRSTLKISKSKFMYTKNMLVSQKIVPEKFRNKLSDNFEYKWIVDHNSDEILRRRNERHVLREFPDTRIGKNTHRKFIKEYDKLPRLDFIISNSKNNDIIGALYVILNNGKLEMGKYIGNKRYLGKGVASSGTSSFINFIKKYFPICDLYAVTKKTNQANINLNKNKNFFIEKDLLNGYIRMRLKLS